MNPVQKIQKRAMSQHGLVTRDDLDEAGVTRGVRRRLQAEGTLERTGPTVFRVGGAPLTNAQGALAATLDTGGKASHRTSAGLHRLGGIVGPPLPEVTIDRRSKRFRSEVARVHTSTWLPESHCVVVDGVPCLNVARTLLSLAALVPNELSIGVLEGAVEDAIATKKATDPWIWWVLEQVRCRGRDGVSVLERVLASREAGFVTESWLEREFLKVLQAGGVPLPTCQQRIAPHGSFVARVDFLSEAAALVIEVSGHAWHHTRAQRVADVARRRRLVLAGYRVLEFTYEDIVGDPARVVATVLAAISGETLVPAS